MKDKLVKIIPPDKIRHLEWNPDRGSVLPSTSSATQSAVSFSPTSNVIFPADVEAILTGQIFYDAKLPDALQQALDYAGTDGIVATMPELIATKIKADKTHDFWQKWYSVQTEENIGIDTNGKYVKPGGAVLITLHGRGLLTPQRIRMAYEEGLVNGSAKYVPLEFSDLLKGSVYGEEIPLYFIDDFKKGISNLPRRYGVVNDYTKMQSLKSGYHTRDEFLNNDLVIARAGGLENLASYFDLAKKSDDSTLGNWHPFSGRDASVSQGRLLFLNGNCSGLDGSGNLSSDGRFVGVAPEAHVAKK